MRLYLTRHAEAMLVEQDPARGLSRRGKAEAESVGRKLARLGAHPARVLCSPKTRARQTAGIIAAALGAPAPIELDGLSPNGSPVDVAAELQAAGEDSLLVSHLPFLPALAERLLAGEKPPGHVFGPGGTLILERDPGGVWTIAAQVEPDVP